MRRRRQTTSNWTSFIEPATILEFRADMSIRFVNMSASAQRRFSPRLSPSPGARKKKKPGAGPGFLGRKSFA